MNERIDVSVVRRLQNGDMGALEEIYSFYKGPLYYYALSILRNPADAEEVMQDVICTVQTKINQLRNSESFHFWLFSIAGNECKGKLRAKDRIIQPNEEHNIEDVVIAPDSPEKEFDDLNILNVILASFQKLSDTYKETAELRFLGGLSMKEIAEKLDVSPSLVKSRLYDIRQYVMADLEQQGYKPETYYSVEAGPLLFVQMQQSYEAMSTGKETTEIELTDYSFLQGVLQGVCQFGSQAASAIGQVLNAIEFSSLVLSSLTVSALVLPSLFGIHDEWLVSGYDILTKPADICRFAEANASDNKVIYKKPSYANIIDVVKYYQNPIAGPLEVRVYLVNGYQNEDISILYEDEKLNYQVTNEYLLFYASVNGRYVINIGNDKKYFDINNIDNDIPVVTSMNYTKGVMRFEIKESKNKIDYKKSYILYKDKKITLPKSKVIHGIYEDVIEVVLVDDKGNKNTFRFNI
ncbi:RNA polymerase sigma factor (sigma-70 family) [Breznakia blatticola]|uniref:RNA polymerase sigma factor (Sigma-70 family) n=1 Tax=Breznakia blatticola TaxID=1754012 RepID=A0A4R7ZQD8_9FIRM|nr:sigma-70 family RNA polymerase sigma factor [Breznakia blatticola]TDW19785.1 RNA polymerase sigma factor (sigma-70 family) [Breznakia blatticola]